ncbi:MAG: serine/threonine-protein kinase [Fuerstiella sp.]
MSEGEAPKPAPKPKKKAVTRIGDFELKKRLGKGGMGEVFLARQVSLDRLVAVKTLSKDLAKKQDFVERFLREARSMAKLDHGNIVRVYSADSFKGVHFAAIEYIDGRSVQDWLNQDKLLPIGDAVHIAAVSAEALLHAHELNMIHRDIKPDNILLTSKGVVKVADFGLAKVLDEDVSMTQSGTGLGTPLYMAPEQARSAKTVDQRSDIYALGATLYHMLVGKVPFNADNTLELILAKEEGKYTPARSLRSDVSERLDLIIDKMMTKDPNHRYSDCAQIITDLTSLGVMNEKLSFIDGAAPAKVTTVANTVASPRTMAIRSADVSSKKDARKSTKSSTPRRVWFVQFEDPEGNLAIEKLSTSRILKMIRTGKITAKGKAKMSAEATYLPLAQYSEFTEAIEDSLSRHSNQARKQDMKSLYKQVEKDQKSRSRWRWIRNKFRALVGTVGLVIWLAVIAGVVGLAWYYGQGLWQWLGESVKGLVGGTDAGT